MTKNIVLRPATSAIRRQPLLETSEYPSAYSRRSQSMAEVAGGTAADCAAVCCCCSCGLVDLVVLAVYRVPAGLCRKALRKQRHRRLVKKGGLQRRKCECDDDLFDLASHVSMVSELNSLPVDREVADLEKEMWDKFYGAGFWRSPSQRSEVSGISTRYI